MVAIETRFLPCTNTKPTRIVAETCNGQRLVMSASKAEDLSESGGRGRDSGTGEKAQAAVAQALADKMGWPGKLVGGGTKRGMCFVFVS